MGGDFFCQKIFVSVELLHKKLNSKLLGVMLGPSPTFYVMVLFVLSVIC